MTGRKRYFGNGVTIRTVAARAGVSAMTVSNVINGKGKVGEATRHRVREAISALDYLPNPAARGLASPGASRLGVIYARPSSVFVSTTLVGALVGTSAYGVQLLARDCEGAEYEALAGTLRSLVDSGASAILLLPPFAECLSGTPIVTELDVPIAAVATGRGLPDMLTVRIDERAAAEALTGLLIAHGHHRIGFIAGPPSHSGSVSRRDGFLAAMRAHGLTLPDDLRAEGDYMFDSGLRAAARLLERRDRPSAIFASNDEMAAATAWTAHRLGMAMPEALALVGFDDSPLAERVFPPLTAVHQPVAEMAQRATEALIEAMRQPVALSRGHDILFDFSLIERESTGAARPTGTD